MGLNFISLEVVKNIACINRKIQVMFHYHVLFGFFPIFLDTRDNFIIAQTKRT